MKSYKLVFVVILLSLVLCMLHTASGVVNLALDSEVSGIISLVCALIWAVVLVLNVLTYGKQIKEDAIDETLNSIQQIKDTLEET